MGVLFVLLLVPPAAAQINDNADYTGAADEVRCGLNRISAGLTLGLSPGTDDDPATTCPAAAQVAIDDLWTDCDGGADWATERPEWQALAERKGCQAGTPQADTPQAQAPTPPPVNCAPAEQTPTTSQLPCPTTSRQYSSGSVATATACGGCDAFGLIALEACKDAADTITCGGAIFAPTSTLLSDACKACVATAAGAAGMVADGSNLNDAMIVRELLPALPPATRRAD